MSWPTVTATSGTTKVDAGAGTYSWTHVVGSGQTLLEVFTGQANNSPNTNWISGVTWNGTNVPNKTSKSDGTFCRIDIWELASPTPATGSVVVTYTAGGDQYSGGSISFDGASTTTGTASNGTNTNPTNPTLTVADSANGDIVISMWVTDDDANATSNNGSTIVAFENVNTDTDHFAQYQTATGANTVCGWTHTGGGGGTGAMLGFAVKQASGSSPAISAASTTSPVHTSALTLTGTGFGASRGTQQVLIGGIPQSVMSWSDTSITLSVYRGTNKYGVSVNAEIWDAGALTSNSFAQSGGLQPPSGWAFVNIGTPNTTASNRLTASPDLASGDQVAYDAIGKPYYPAGGVRIGVATDGTYSSDPFNTFDFEVWSASAWGLTATQTINALVDTFLYDMPEDADPDDVRLRDPTTGGNSAQLNGVGIAKAIGAGALTTQDALAGAGLSTALGSGALTAGGTILTGAGTATATGAGTLTTQAALVGAGLAAGQGVGALTAGGTILAGAGVAPATGSGTFSPGGAGVALAGAGTGAAAGAGALVAGGTILAGAGVAPATGSGTFSPGGAGVALAGAGTATATGAGTLTTQAALVGAGLAAGQGSGALTAGGTILAGAGVALATGSGTLSPGGTGAALAGAGAASSSGIAALSTAAALAAIGRAMASSSATLTTRALLAGMGISTAAGSATLTPNYNFVGTPEATWRVPAESRTYLVEAEDRIWRPS